MNVLSIAVRVKRTIVEFGYVRVPVTGSVMTTEGVDEGGKARIDGEKVFEQAVALARAGSGNWYREEEQVEVHPVQKPLEQNEEYLRWPDGFKPWGDETEVGNE
jgi:hypothetical protein